MSEYRRFLVCDIRIVVEKAYKNIIKVVAKYCFC